MRAAFITLGCATLRVAAAAITLMEGQGGDGRCEGQMGEGDIGWEFLKVEKGWREGKGKSEEEVDGSGGRGRREERKRRRKPKTKATPPPPRPTTITPPPPSQVSSSDRQGHRVAEGGANQGGLFIDRA